MLALPPTSPHLHSHPIHPPALRSVAVGDTLIDCASVLGGGRMLQLLVEPLLQLSKQVTSGAAFDWRTAEAALYCIRAVHRCAPLPGDALMTSLFSSLPQLPVVPQLQYTVALTVGAYSDWLADTAQRGDEGRTLLGQVRTVCRWQRSAVGLVLRWGRSWPCPASLLAGRRLEVSSASHCTHAPLFLSWPTTPVPYFQLLGMLMRCLPEAEASSAAALSIRRLCDGCAGLLAAGSMDQLMALYRQVQGSGDVAQNVYDLDLDEDDVQQVG